MLRYRAQKLLHTGGFSLGNVADHKEDCLTSGQHCTFSVAVMGKGDLRVLSASEW